MNGRILQEILFTLLIKILIIINNTSRSSGRIDA